MKYFLKIVLIVVIAWILSQFMPFYGVAIAGFITSLVIRTSPFSSFATGFIGIFLLWGISAFWIDMETQSLLTAKIGEIFSLSPPVLILVTGILGGITGGLGALTGAFIANK